MAIEPKTTDWDALRLMRLHGHKPALRVIVTTKPHLPRRLEGVGCLTILHKAGEVMPIKLLDGLDVILFFDRCELGSAVMRLAESKGVTFSSVRVWCNCAGMLSILAMSCDSYAGALKWEESFRAT